MKTYDTMIVFEKQFSTIPTVKIVVQYSQGSSYYDYEVSDITATSFHFHIHSKASHEINPTVTWTAEAPA